MLISRFRRACSARRSITCSFALLAILAGGRAAANIIQGATLTPVPSAAVAGVYSVVPSLPTGSGRFLVLGYALDEAGGQLLASRFYEDGSVSASHGESGVSRRAFPSPVAGAVVYPFAARTLPNGDYVVGIARVESGVTRFGLGRAASAQAPAENLSADAFATLSFGTANEVVTDFTVQADGSFIVVGRATHSADTDVAVARYLPNGTIDTTFGNSGVVLVRLSDDDDGADAVAIQTDGRILVAGFTTGASTGTDSFVMRLNRDGSIDADFAANGTFADVLPGHDAARSLALQPDGKILVGGFATHAQTNAEEVLVYRLTPDGTLDTGFAKRGRAITSTASTRTRAEQLLVFSNGTFVAVGPYIKSSGAGGIMNLQFVANDRNRDGFEEPWDVLADHVELATREDALPNSAQYTDEIVVAGLDDQVAVPVRIYDGEYALNGASDYRTTMGWARNGDRIRVRHIAAPGHDEASVSMLSIGGWVTDNDLSWFEGIARSLFFRSKTAKSGPNALGFGPQPIATPSSKSGGGASGIESLIAAAMAVAYARRRRSPVNRPSATTA
ncbi:MAG: hypothetical protein ACFCUG_00110 [Thiotrichales bacterium]